MDAVPKFRAPLALVMSTALGFISSRFENPASPDNCLAYHNRGHTYGVISRAVEIAEAMDLPPREVMLVQIAASFHDTFQFWSENRMEGGIVKRARHVGDNETASALEAVRAMRASGIGFTPTEIGHVASAILATIPAWSPEHGTVIQPMLNRCSHPIVRAVALADLSSPGMDPDCFVRDGIQLFGEENLDVMRALSSARSSAHIHPAMQLAWRERLVSWLTSQVGFARGRQALLESELQGLEQDQQRRVASMFCHFDESIRRGHEAVRQAESMDFVPLMRQFLRGAFPDEE